MAHGYYADGKWHPTATEEEAVAGWKAATKSGTIPITPPKDEVQHGYYDSGGGFTPTATKEEAVDAWRREQGYSTGGIYDMGGGEIIDTRGISAITPAIQDGPVAPTIAGLEEAYAPPQTYLGQLEKLGINLPTDDPYAGMKARKESGRLVGKNVEQIKEELSKQIGYDITERGGVPGGQGRQVPEEILTLGPGVRTAEQLNNELRAARDLNTIKNIFLSINKWGTSIPEPLPTYGGPENLLLTQEEERQRRLAGELEPLISEPPQKPVERADLTGLRPKAGSYYGAGSNPKTLPKNAEGEAYLPSAFLKLSEQIQRGHRTDMEIAESLAERLMTAPHLAPLSENPPENILLNIGDKPNDAFVRIQQIILAYLEQEAARYPSDVDIQAIYAKFKGATSLEEFYAMLNYGPSESNPINIWTRKAGLLNENVLDPADVAASILSGQSFYAGNKNPGLFSGGGGGGGGSGRRAVSNSWGQAPGGLFLWRISA